ncbi:MAG: DUF3536 domain-containing protein [Deltaproteobacteria bacterium]
MEKHICIHGHFYQPPRENPWLEEVELQDSAYPYHDWNARICAQCYGPNTDSRILNYERKIIDIVCNYNKISFNFGPTLLLWMQLHEPEIYNAIIEADRNSRKNFSGHGAALAQCYNHMIMPLANERDRVTQVKWGKEDFVFRFGRQPEGMWLPETAVDTPTLELLAGEGFKFTILSPTQAKACRRIGADRWEDASGGRIDTRKPYLCRLPSGKSIVLFFYNGPVSQSIAFSNMLDNGEHFAKSLSANFSEDGEDQIVSIATDGESYGHHHPFGDMALAYCLYFLETNKLGNITVYGQFLERNPPQHEVQVFEASSWSCFHGVERWRGNCGCNSGMHREWNQSWRAPLRGAMDWLRDNIARIYENCAGEYVQDPWALRNDYIHVILDRSTQNVNRFLFEHTGRELAHDDKVRLLKLLEMQRAAMLMYTSCGWFFDEISGVETVQVLMYAARALQIAGEMSGMDLEHVFMELLERAPSNLREYQTGKAVYEKLVRPAVLDFKRVGAHYAISLLFKEYPKISRLYSFTVDNLVLDLHEVGRQRMALGKAHIRSNVHWEEGTINYCVLHIGEHNVFGVVRQDMEEAAFLRFRQELSEAFQRGDISQTIQLMQKHFPSDNYTLWHLFKDEQREILNKILDSSIRELETALRQINEHHFSIIQVMKQMNVPLPKIMENTEEILLNKDILNEMAKPDTDPARLDANVKKALEWKFSIDRLTLGFITGRKIDGMMREWSRHPQEVELLRRAEALLKVVKPLGMTLELGKSQNIYFAVGKRLYSHMKAKAEKGDDLARDWVSHFNRFGDFLRVKIA